MGTKHYITVYYNGQHGYVNGVNNGGRVLVADDSSVTFTFTPYQGYYPYSAVLNGVTRSIYGNQLTVWGRNSDQTLTVHFASIYSPPKTGDDANVALWIALGGLSAVALGALLFMSKKKNKTEALSGWREGRDI